MRTFQIGLFLLGLLVLSITSPAQNIEALDSVIETHVEAEEYEQAILLINKKIGQHPEGEHLAPTYLLRAMLQAELGNYDDAISDAIEAEHLDSTLTDAIIQIGVFKAWQDQWGDAIIHFDRALHKDSTLAEAYAYKGMVFYELSEYNKACQNYEKALRYGFTDVASSIYHNCDSNSVVLQKFTYQILTDKSKDESYGYEQNNPIKVGHQNPTAQRAYLSLLRDSKGKPVKYERKGSRVAYPSENGFMGWASVDIYEVKYRNQRGKKETAILYLSFYDYEEPRIPVGFFSVQDFTD